MFKLIEVSRHKSVDTLRGYIRKVEIFEERIGSPRPLFWGPSNGIDKSPEEISRGALLGPAFQEAPPPDRTPALAP